MANFCSTDREWDHTVSSFLTIRRGWAVGLVALATAAAIALPSTAAADPPGNNGTVKVDGIDFDDHPNNEPHVGCVFQIDYYGYDMGDFYATAKFVGIPPPAENKNVRITKRRTFIGGDAAGGGTDLDGSVTVNLQPHLWKLTPFQDGTYHIKLTVNSPDGNGGTDVKHKVFWVSGCEVIDS